MLGLLSRDTWDPSHNLVNVGGDVVFVESYHRILVNPSNILHGVGAVVNGQGTRLTYGVDLSHVPDGRRRHVLDLLDHVENFLVS